MKALIPQNLTRFAPTPSGFLHLGNVYSFVLTSLFAKRSNSKILLRIDNMDTERTKEKYIVDIFETLDFLGLPYDEGPLDLLDFKKNFSQHLRLDKYQKLVDELKLNNSLFVCDCSRKKIEKMNPKGFYTGFCKTRDLQFDQTNVVWRMKTPPQTLIEFLDWNGKLQTGKLPAILRDFVIRKKDEKPSYQLCSLADDLHFGVTHIVRGNDLFGSTLAQVYLSKRLKDSTFENIHFHHHPLIKGPDFKKLSKSAGAISIQAMRKSGKKKEEIYSLLGNILGIKKPVRKWQDFENLDFKI